MTQVLPPVRMPQLSGGPERARALAAPLRGRMAGAIVRLDCRQLIAGTGSFANEIVKAVLVEGRAHQLVAEYASDDFASHLRDAARDLGVSERLAFI